MDQSIFSDLLMILCALFIALSLFMSEIARMRFLFIIASIIFLLYGFTVSSPVIIAASCIFTAINGYFLAQIPLTLRKARLPGKLVDIYKIYKNHISTEEFVRIMEEAENKTFMKETLIDQGEVIQKLLFLITGNVNIIKNGKIINTLGPGNFVGEIGILTGNKSLASVECKGIVEVSMWNKSIIQHESKLRQLISINLIDKLVYSSEQHDLEDSHNP